jgi:hypothetical protein
MTSWDEDEQKVLERARERKIRVLVWGRGVPGAGASPEDHLHYQKRIQIKDKLSATYPNGQIHFSEERSENLPTIDSELVKEAAQARTADLIVALATPGARGVEVELDTMSTKYTWFPPKTHVLLPEVFLATHGIVREVYERFPKRNLHGFTEVQLKECVVATKIAVSAVDTWALAQHLSDL